jgi:hypothetical protein
MYLIIAGILGCFLAMFVVAARGSGPSLKKLPPLDPALLFDKKEAALWGDLKNIAEKLKLGLAAKPPLGCVVQAKEQNLRASWRQALMAEYVDFVLCDLKTAKPVLAVLQSGEGRGESRGQVVARALEAAAIPVLYIGNYNAAGLEKAVREKAGDLGGAKQGRRRRPAQADEAAGAEPAEGSGTEAS